MNKEFIKKVIDVQKALKAPKNQRNNFGGYNYRSAEDILEAVKPHLYSAGLLLTITDTLVYESGRFYVKATATLTDGESSIFTEAMAREEEIKKGQDASQITGSASSYARKYALNGLFSIDDTKDADATNTHGKEEEQPKSKTKEDVFKEVAACTDLAKLKSIYEEHRNEKYNKELYDKVVARKAQIEKGAK